MAEYDPSEIHHLQIVVAHHDANEFYTLGRIMPEDGGASLDWNGAIVLDVTHEVPPAVLFEKLPDTPCPVVDGKSTHEHMCIILDACDETGQILDDSEITPEIADKLLDGQFEQRLETARGNLAAYYKRERGA